MLQEVTPGSPDLGDKKLNINTDETEEKDVAIQMLAVFIDELRGGFAEYIEPTSRILLPLATFELNDGIRSSVAGCFPGLIICAREANPENRAYIIQMAKTFAETLWKAIKEETETETLIGQF